MALSTHKNATYIKLKDGKFYKSDDKQHETPYTQITGRVVGLGFKDEFFNGSSTKKFHITMTDGDEKYVVTFPVDSPAFGGFVSYAKNVDLSNPIHIHAMGENFEFNGKQGTRTKLLISSGEGENEVFAKSFYTKDGKNQLPKFKKVRVSGRDQWDKTDYLDFLVAVVENELMNSLGREFKAQPTVFKDSPKKKNNSRPVEDGDLPF